MKKVFVSHSSLDKEIVDVFIDKILKLGFCLRPEDIAYTSREDTGVPTGDDIKQFIKDNISGCDFVFFMISNNYAQSQICLNEMGAAWAADRKVIPIVLPDVGFDSIGWLYNVHKGIKLNNSSALDTLFEEVNEKYEHKLKVSAWNIYKAEFLNQINDLIIVDPPEIIDTQEEEELDLLDCREKFDENIETNNKATGELTASMSEHTKKTTLNNKNLTDITNKVNATPVQTRNIMLKAAHDNDTLSEVYERIIPILKSSFEQAIYYGIKMRELSPLDDNAVEGERNAISGLISTFQDSLQSANEFKNALENDKTQLDKTYSKSKNRLKKNASLMAETLAFCIDKANELLNYT